MPAQRCLNFGSEPLNWKTTKEDFETLAVTETINPSQFSSQCIVAPIVTSSIFKMEEAVATPLKNGADSCNGGTSFKRRADNSKLYENSRVSNPTRDIAENALAKLEGSKYALLFGSGVAAIAPIVYMLGQGDHLISRKPSYAGTVKVCAQSAQYGISTDFVTSDDVEELIKRIRPNTKLILVETPANPTLRLIDIAELARRVREVKADIIIAVDNTLMTPLLQRPLDLGADVVFYSCSKYIGGHGDIIMGAVTTNSDDIYRRINDNLSRLGSIPSSFDCYLLIRSLKTLPLRIQQHCKNGLAVAKFLETHPQVGKVLYPGLMSHTQHELALRQQFGGNGLIGFYLKGGAEAACTFLNSTKVILRAPSFGANCSVAQIPARTTQKSMSETERQSLGITDNYIRLSVGLESSNALIQDLDQALKATILQK